MRAPARAAYQRAIDLDENEFRWRYFMSIVMLEEGAPETIESFQRAVALRPDYAPALFRLGDELSRADRLDEARSAYETGRDHAPDDMHGLLGMARLADANDQLDDAMALLVRAEEINADSRELQSLLARVHQRLGDRDASSAAAARAAEASESLPRDDPVLHEVLSYGASAHWMIVYGNQAMDSTIDPFLGPLTLGHVMIDTTAHWLDPLNHPIRFAERGHEEPHTLLERRVDPFVHQPNYSRSP